MDNYNFIQPIISYVENRVKGKLDYTELAHSLGYSYAHTREIFQKHTKTSLGRYLISRKISHAAFELIHTNKNILDIALDYGFNSPDTFTRAFRRITGTTPREFRNLRPEVGKVKLNGNSYGPGIKNARIGLNLIPQLEDSMETKRIQRNEESTILYGVPKVGYGPEECTPFPSVLKACLNYMGQEIHYADLMVSSGAAFRLRWNTTHWDGGNVDISCIYENHLEAYKRSFLAAGRSFRILERKPETGKKEFIQFIRHEINEGRPVIALGIIGPPEACIITGYRDQGNTLLGWNFFQENPEFAGDVAYSESGYFISQKWWDNPDTLGLMSIGEEKGDGASLKEILENALQVLGKEKINDYAGGQAAYDAWSRAICDGSQFPENASQPLLFDHLMCQIDAVDMISEGRGYASYYLKKVAKDNEQLSKLLLNAAVKFKEESDIGCKMMEMIGGFNHNEETVRKFARPEIRKEISELILQAKMLDNQAREILNKILDFLQ